MKAKSIVITALCVSSLSLCAGTARCDFPDGSILRSLPSGNVAADSAYHVNKDAERKEIEQLKADRQKRKEELKEKKQKRSEKRREKKELRKLKKQERKQKREDALRLKKEQAEAKAENAVEGVTENPGAAKVETAAEAPAEIIPEPPAEKSEEPTYREKLDAVMKEIGAENQLKKTDNEAALKQEAKKTADTKEAPSAAAKPESKEPVKAATELAPENASKPSETVKDVVANPEPVQTENTPSEAQEDGKLSRWKKLSDDLRSLTTSAEPKPEQEAAKQNELKEEFIKKEAAKQSSKKEIYTMPQTPAKKGVNVEIRQNGQ